MREGFTFHVPNIVFIYPIVGPTQFIKIMQITRHVNIDYMYTKNASQILIPTDWIRNETFVDRVLLSTNRNIIENTNR